MGRLKHDLDVDKNIPLQVIWETISIDDSDDGIYGPRCPYCGAPLRDEQPRCWDCDQVLDWKKGEI